MKTLVIIIECVEITTVLFKEPCTGLILLTQWPNHGFVQLVTIALVSVENIP